MLYTFFSITLFFFTSNIYKYISMYKKQKQKQLCEVFFLSKDQQKAERTEAANSVRIKEERGGMKKREAEIPSFIIPVST